MYNSFLSNLPAELRPFVSKSEDDLREQVHELNESDRMSYRIFIDPDPGSYIIDSSKLLCTFNFVSEFIQEQSSIIYGVVKNLLCI